jgi:hypothetical protein
MQKEEISSRGIVLIYKQHRLEKAVYSGFRGDGGTEDIKYIYLF